MSLLLKIGCYAVAVVLFFALVLTLSVCLARALAPRRARCSDRRRPWSPHHPAAEVHDGRLWRAPALRDAPVKFCGWQDACGVAGRRPLELWTLVEDIPGHPRHSTLSRETLERAGYWVPIPPVPCPR